MRRGDASLAWSWRHAIVESDLPGTTRHLLLTLSVRMDETGGSCFPSIQQLVDMTGLTKNTVLKHVAIAVEKGWLGRSQHGYRGQKWKRAEYIPQWPGRGIAGAAVDEDGLEDEGGAADAPPSCDQEVVHEVDEGGAADAPKVVQQMHQDKTSPETTPVTSPSEREGARAVGQEGKGDDTAGPTGGDEAQGEVESNEAAGAADDPQTAAFRKRVQRFCSGSGFVAGAWPDWDTTSLGWIARQFATLSAADREVAERWRDAYLLDIAERRKKPMAPGVFLRDRAWQALDPSIMRRLDARKAASAKPEQQARPDGWAAMAGPVGMAMLFSNLLNGPKDERAAETLAARGFWTDPQLRGAWPDVWTWKALRSQKGGAVFGDNWHAMKPAMEPVPVGSAVFAAWREAFAARGWPWLNDFERGEVFYAPKGGPAGLGEFEAAIRGGNDGERAEIYDQAC